MNYKFLLIIFTLFLTSCAGTGTKDFSLVNDQISKPDSNLIVMYRDKAFTCGACVMDVELNGENIGKIGNGEFLTHPYDDGINTVKIKVDNFLQGLGMNKPTLQFESNDVDNNIYILIDIDAGWNSAEIELMEVSERTFKNKAK